MSGIDRIRSYRLSQRMKLTILSVLFWGVLAHLYMYMNRIVNHDAVFALKYSGATVTSGRWFLHILVEISNKFHNNYVTPWWIGGATLALYAACACVLVKVFDIRSKPLCCILGAILVTYPTVTSNNLYIFTAHYYALALLLSCGSVLVLRLSGRLPAILAGSLMIACSLGIYQAYIPFILCMYVLMILLESLRPAAVTRDIIRRALTCFAALVGGLVLYFVVNRCFLRLTGSQMDTYMGLDSMGRIDPAAIPSMLRQCYSSFVGLFLENYHGVNHKPWLRIVMLLCTLFAFGSGAFLIRRNKVCPLHIGFVCITVILLPIAIGAMYIMTQTEKAICTMTVFATIFVFIVPICMADRVLPKLSVNRAFLVELCLCASLVFVPVYYSSLANETYLSMEYSMQNINAYYTELAAQIKSLEGFSPELKVAFLGENQDPSIPQIDCDYIIRGTFTPAELVNIYSREAYMTMHCGYGCTFVKDKESLQNDDRVKEMPAYPANGSIRIIDDVIVVKFS